MTTFILILKKEFRQIFRDPAILRLIFLMPVMQLILLPFAADYEVKNIKVGIIDLDHSDYSRSLITKFENSSYFRLAAYSSDHHHALSWLEKEDADLVIEIPPKFEATLIRENSATLQLIVNAVNGTKGNLGAAYTTGVIQQFNQEIRKDWFEYPRFLPEPFITVATASLYNPYSDYQRFMVPGILAVLLTMTGGFLSALNIVKEKELGTIEQLNVTPIRKYQFILGKLVPFWLLGFVILTLGLIVSYVVHGIMPGANIGNIYIFAALYLVAIVGFGLLLSNFTSTQQQAMMVAFFFMLIFILLSGLYTTIESMPPWARKIAYINPLTYLVDAMRMVLLKGATLRDLFPHMRVIATIGIVLNVLAIWTYHKRS